MLNEGAVIAGGGIVVGVLGGYPADAASWAAYLTDVRLPGIGATAAAAALLALAAVAASLIPASRAARVDVAQALRSE